MLHRLYKKYRFLTPQKSRLEFTTDKLFPLILYNKNANKTILRTNTQNGPHKNDYLSYNNLTLSALPQVVLDQACKTSPKTGSSNCWYELASQLISLDLASTAHTKNMLKLLTTTRDWSVEIAAIIYKSICHETQLQ